MTSFPPVTKIVDGQPVDSNTTNRPINDLEIRTNCLNDRVKQLVVENRNVFDVGQPCDDACLDSQIVYFDETDQKYKQAITEVTPFGTTQILLPSDKSFAVGMIKNITGSLGNRIGDIFTHGFIEGVDTANLYETTSTPNLGVPLHLTQTIGEEGRVTDVRNDRETFIGIFVSPTLFFLNPELRNLNDNHQHINFELDITKWVDLGGGDFLYPASELPNFPPTPFENLYIFFPDEGLYTPVNNPSSVITVDADGITFTDNLSFGTDPVNDPAVYDGTRVFYTMRTPGNNLGVDSLEPKNDSISVTNPITGNDATTGPLCIALNLALDIITEEGVGSNVVKSLVINSTTGQIDVTRGRVVESILAGTGIELSSNQGNVVVSATQEGSVEREITDTLLQNAKQRVIPGEGVTPYIEFPNVNESRVNAKFVVPDSAIINNIQIFGTFFGLVSDPNDAGFRIQYKVIPNNGSLTGPFTISNITMNFADAFVMSNELMLTIPSGIVSNGALVSFQIIRDVADVYPGDVGLLNLKFKM